MRFQDCKHFRSAIDHFSRKVKKRRYVSSYCNKLVHKFTNTEELFGHVPEKINDHFIKKTSVSISRVTLSVGVLMSEAEKYKGVRC